MHRPNRCDATFAGPHRYWLMMLSIIASEGGEGGRAKCVSVCLSMEKTEHGSKAGLLAIGAFRREEPEVLAGNPRKGGSAALQNYCTGHASMTIFFFFF